MIKRKRRNKLNVKNDLREDSGHSSRKENRAEALSEYQK